MRTVSVVTVVTDPEIEDEQGVYVCVPGAYVKGIDTNGIYITGVTGDGAEVAISDGMRECMMYRAGTSFAEADRALALE